MTAAEEQPLSAEDQHEVLRVARAAGADLSAAVPQVLRSPTEADVSLARAAHDLRPAALPWSSLSDAMRQNLAIGVIPLRLALIAEGWVPPSQPAPRAIDRCPARIWPAWASGWVICASEIVRGHCVRYGHPAGATPAPTSGATDGG